MVSSTSEELGAACAPLYVEVLEGIGYLAPEDELAIRRAFGNAAVVGYRHGVAATVYSVQRQHPHLTVDVTIDSELADPWGPAEDGELATEWDGDHD
jgi:hypothetical protein